MKTIKSFDNADISVLERFDSKEPKGIVHIILKADNLLYFGELCAYLNARGYMAVGAVMREHQKQSANSEDFLDTVKDTAFLAKHYRENFPDLKYIVYGQDSGSFIAQAFLARYSRFCDGVVLDGKFINRFDFLVKNIKYLAFKKREINAPLPINFYVFKHLKVRETADKELALLILDNGDERQTKKLYDFYKDNNYVNLQFKFNEHDQPFILFCQRAIIQFCDSL